MLSKGLRSVFSATLNPCASDGEFLAGLDYLLHSHGRELRALDLRQIVLEALVLRLALGVNLETTACEGQPFLEIAASVAVLLDLGTPFDGIQLDGITAAPLQAAHIMRGAAKVTESARKILCAIAQTVGLSDAVLPDFGDAGSDCNLSIFTSAFASELRKRYDVLRRQRGNTALQKHTLESTLVGFLKLPPHEVSIETFVALTHHSLELHSVDLRESLLECVFLWFGTRPLPLFIGRHFAAAARLLGLGATLTRIVKQLCTSPVGGSRRFDVLVGAAHSIKRGNELREQLSRWKEVACEHTRRQISAAECNIGSLIDEASDCLLQYLALGFSGHDVFMKFAYDFVYPKTRLDGPAKKCISRLVLGGFLAKVTASFVFFLEHLASMGGRTPNVYNRVVDGFRHVFRAACHAQRDAELIAMINKMSLACDLDAHGTFPDNLASFCPCYGHEPGLPLAVLNALRRSGLLGPYFTEVKATVERAPRSGHRQRCIDLMCKWELQDRQYATYMFSVLKRTTGDVAGHLIATFALAEPLPFVVNAGAGDGAAMPHVMNAGAKDEAAVLCARRGLYTATGCCCAD